MVSYIFISSYSLTLAVVRGKKVLFEVASHKSEFIDKILAHLSRRIYEFLCKCYQIHA